MLLKGPEDKLLCNYLTKLNNSIILVMMNENLALKLQYKL